MSGSDFSLCLVYEFAILVGTSYTHIYTVHLIDIIATGMIFLLTS